jgi:hypothetical protein
MIGAGMGNEALRSEDFLRFVETNEFVSQWQSLGLDNEIDLWDLQIMIMRNPEVGKVVAGTGGLRKMRFGRPSDRIGKRAGVRVCYVYFREHAIVLLVTAYGKHQTDDLSAREKKYVREYIERTRTGLKRRKGLQGKTNGESAKE